jgi:hypothetical protein
LKRPRPDAGCHAVEEEEEEEGEIKEDALGGACGTHERRYTQGFGGKPERKRPLGTASRKRDDNSKVNFEELGKEHVD